MRAFVAILAVLAASVQASGSVFEVPLACEGEYTVDQTWTTTFDLGLGFTEISNIYIDWSGSITAELVDGYPFVLDGQFVAKLYDSESENFCGSTRVQTGADTYPFPKPFDLLSVFSDPGWAPLLDGRGTIEIGFWGVTRPMDLITLEPPSGQITSATLVFEGTVNPLELVEPDGGEPIVAGATYTVRWIDFRDEPNCLGDYVLDYSIDDGQSWIHVDSNSVSNSCSYDWLVPAVDSNECLVRISDANDASIYDTSDAVFTISVGLQEARTITVDDDGPGDFSSIQAAIDDANDGDTIIVSDGTYTGAANRGIEFFGKAITVRSENGPDTCIVDCQQQDRGFFFQHGEDANAVLDGLTIENGREYFGGGINCQDSSPTIRNCIINANRAIWHISCDPMSGICIYSGAEGGGIYSGESSPLITNCIISNNTADSDGGGLRCYSRGEPSLSPILKNCIITGNQAAEYGDGLYGCLGEISNCTILNNVGHGLRHCGNRIKNCIIWGNADDLSKYTYATYSCIEDGDAGVGNISSDPCFADLNNGDYHLKSQGGRWNPNEERWTTDEVTSLCIDAGDSITPIGFEPFPNGGIVNMGAYGGTAEASKSYFGGPPCETIVAGDINGDCRVDYLDFRFIALHWLEGG